MSTIFDTRLCPIHNTNMERVTLPSRGGEYSFKYVCKDCEDIKAAMYKLDERRFTAACAAMQGFYCNPDVADTLKEMSGCEEVATVQQATRLISELAVQQADALIKELEK